MLLWNDDDSQVTLKQVKAFFPFSFFYKIFSPIHSCCFNVCPFSFCFVGPRKNHLFEKDTTLLHKLVWCSKGGQTPRSRQENGGKTHKSPRYGGKVAVHDQNRQTKTKKTNSGRFNLSSANNWNQLTSTEKEKVKHLSFGVKKPRKKWRVPKRSAIRSGRLSSFFAIKTRQMETPVEHVNTNFSLFLGSFFLIYYTRDGVNNHRV